MVTAGFLVSEVLSRCLVAGSVRPQPVCVVFPFCWKSSIEMPDSLEFSALYLQAEQV